MTELTEPTEPTAPETEPTAEAPTAPEQTEDETTELTEADREKLTGVVQKERQAAKAARAAAEAAEKRLAEMEAAEVRRTVTEELELTPAQATFLTGETAEEMKASGEALLAAFPTRDPLRRRPIERLRTGATGISEPAESMSNVADRILD